MSKSELISALADKTGKSQKEAKAFLVAFLSKGNISPRR